MLTHTQREREKERARETRERRETSRPKLGKRKLTEIEKGRGVYRIKQRK